MDFEVSIDDLDAFAGKFWTAVRDAKLFAFHGEMGAGKTTIISSLCKAKGAKEAASSPTFSIINEYAYTEDNQQKKIYHIDLYRLKDWEEVVQAGVEDCVYSNEICFVEWPEKAPELFDATTVHVFIEPVSTSKRLVKLEIK